jgi:hypothetical protein
MMSWDMSVVFKRKRAKELLTEIIGTNSYDAIQAIRAVGLQAVVLELDGQKLSTSHNFDPDRVGLVVQQGVVKGAQIG